MNAKFHYELNLKNSQQTVAARGPCENWLADDKSAVIKDVTVRRGGVVVASSAGSTTVQNGDQDWKLDASSASQLARGLARVDANVTVTRTDNSTYDRPWWRDVQLV